VVAFTTLTNDIAEEALGLRQPAAAFRHAAYSERGKLRFHLAFSVPMPSGRQQAARPKGTAGCSSARCFASIVPDINLSGFQSS
jgi:hypothetical protein